MDLSKYTEIELIILRKEINDEINKYADRAKTKVYSLFIPFDGWRHYINEQNCKNELLEQIEDGIFSDDEFKIKNSYLNDAELEFCKDYYSENR